MLARNSKRRLSGIIALVVVALLAPPTGRAIAAGGDGQQEGIKVHGDWTIEIRDPDGTLVTRHEFKNSLTSGNPTDSGTAFLAQLLRGSIGVKEWVVRLGGRLPQPCGSDPNPSDCYITAPNSGFALPGVDIAKTLVLALTSTGEGLELSGNATAARAARIDLVTTDVFLITGVQHSFTSKGLSTPVAVAAGQIVQVKVVISFS